MSNQAGLGATGPTETEIREDEEQRWDGWIMFGVVFSAICLLASISRPR
jgi:hypothetical protein